MRETRKNKKTVEQKKKDGGRQSVQQGMVNE